MKIRLASPLQTDSIVDGEGIRMVVWTQGCSHNCKGCHNPLTHSFTGGYETDTSLIKEEISKIKDHDGITFSGGDPMFQIDACLDIAKYAKSLGLNIWVYTGFTFEELLSKNNNKLVEFLSIIGVLIDGKFIIEEKSLTLKFRGSRNQRIINVKDSLKKKKVVLIKKYKDTKTSIKNKEQLYI